MSDYIDIKKECLLTWLDKQNIQCDCGTTDLYEELLDFVDEISETRYQQGRQDMYNELQETEIKAHDKYIREEFIERIYSKFNQDSTLSIVFKNTMNDILKEYN